MDLTVDPDGYPVLAGAFSGKLDFDGRVIEALPPGQDPVFGPWEPTNSLFLAKLAPEGCAAPFAVHFDLIKSESSPAYADAAQISVTTDASGDLFYAAAYPGAVDFGGGAIANAALVKFSAQGEHRWSKEVAATDGMALARLAVDAAGDVFVAGLFLGEVSIGGAQLGVATPGRVDAFVAKLDAAGTILWSKILVLASLGIGPSTLSVAAWPSGQVGVSGVYDFYGTKDFVDLGGGAEQLTGSLGYQIGFVTSFDGAGKHLWDQGLAAFPVESAVDSAGRLVIRDGSSALTTAFLTRASNGETIPNDATTPTTEGTDLQMRLGPNGAMLLGGQVSGQPQGNDHVVVSKLDPAGKLVWTRSFGGPPGVASQYRAVSAFGPSGNVWVAGAFSGGLDFGQGLLTSEGNKGNPDIFLAQLPH